MSLGGDQVIPRPPSWEPGPPAPWHEKSIGPLTLEHVRASFVNAPAPRPVPPEFGDGRASAVVAPLYEAPSTSIHGESETHVVLTRRAHHLRIHSGEVSFPGGRQEPGEDLWQTALREAWEEVSLPPEICEQIGVLDHLRTVSSESFIVPFIGALPLRPELVADPNEVAAVLDVPLSQLLAPESFRSELWTISGQTRAIYFFDIPGDTIWGATAAMLRNFLAIVTGTFDPSDRPEPWRIERM